MTIILIVVFYLMAFSVNFKVDPVSVSQIDTYYNEKAELAIDGDLTTKSNTNSAWDTDLWYKMRFDAVRCFSEVVIVQAHLNSKANRMNDTKVFVVNTNTGTESLCGILKASTDLTIEGQTYRIPCNLKCGDEVKLTVRHDNGKYDNPACIHMIEIVAYHIAGLI